MAFLDAAPFDTPAALDPYRNEALGLLLSALMPLAAAFAVAGLVTFVGAADTVPLLAGPDAWLYLPLFALWGAAHWFAAREGEAGHRAGRWVLGLIAWGLVYPFLPALTDPFWLSGFTLVWLLLVAATALRLARVSRPALLLVLPSFLWVALAAIPGYVLLTNGWSPGFAVTVGALDGTGGD